jgi:HK97 family phage portal protein
MGMWDWLPGRKTEQKGVVFSDEWANYFALNAVKSGVTVNWERALDVTTVLAVVRVLCNGVAQVPLQVMKELPTGGALPALEHSLYPVLNRKPNSWQTSFAMRETMMLHLVLTGNAFFYKNMVRNRVKSLIPIDPGCVSMRRNPDYSIEYTVTSIDGTSQVLPQSLIWHVRGPSWDNWRGMDAVRRAREAIGLSIATENTQAEMHANGLQMTGTYSTENKIDPEKYKQIQAWIAAQIGGPNKHKPFIIDSGFKWTPQSMTGVDSQHLETRKYQVEQICQAFGVLPIMIGFSGDKNATFASAEQMFLAHAVHTLMPWYDRIQQSIDNDLLDGDEDVGYFAKFNANGLMKGAHADRAEFYAKALGSGGSPAWMTQDEIRVLEDMNPMGGEAAVLPKPPLPPTGGAKPGDKPKEPPK